MRLAQELGDGGEFRAPMAIGVIGGLLVSTMLSLIFVPAVFSIMDTVGNFIWWLFGRFIGKSDEPGAVVAAHAPVRVETPEPRREATSPGFGDREPMPIAAE